MAPITNRPDDEELTLHYYGEHPAPEELERALAADPELARRWQRLRRELDAFGAVEPPEPRAGLEGRLWHRLEPELATARRARYAGSTWMRFALGAAAALALVAGGFLAGRTTRVESSPAIAVADAPLPFGAGARERLLEASLDRHLESSERLLVELANDPGGDAAFAAEERRLAQALLDSNRLYRRAAERAGQRRVAALLAELEPLLLELAHAPTGDGEGAVAAARQHLESRDLLFKVRVTKSRT